MGFAVSMGMEAMIALGAGANDHTKMAAKKRGVCEASARRATHLQPTRSSATIRL